MRTTIRQNNTDYKTFLAADRSDAFSMRGALTDVLVADGESIFMRHMRFDGKLVQQETKRPHLFSTFSLLDGAEHHRLYSVLGTGDFSRTPVAFPWMVKSLAVPYGLMLVFDGKTVWGVHRIGQREHTDHYALFATPRPDPSDEESLLPDFATRSGKKSTAGDSWTTALPLRPRAMIRAGDILFIGGETAESVSKSGPAPRDAAIEQNKGGLLRMVSCSDGRTLGETRLDSRPVWDGMAAAGGRLYLTTEDGHVICMGSK